MQHPTHPEDERLSALASRDAEATEDAALTSHVASCARCADLVAELGALRMALAELPDLEPPRPLQLLPPASSEPAGEGIGAWVRRLFAPAMTAGAAVAMVGLIGTAAPALSGMASGPFQDSGTELGSDAGRDMDGAGDGGEAAEQSEAGAPAAAGEDSAYADATAAGRPSVEEQADTLTDEDAAEDRSRVEQFGRELPAERSPWPMVLFTGLALMVAAALLRWILVPRAG